MWLSLSEHISPTGPSAYIHKVWDGIATCKVAIAFLDRATISVDKAHLLATGAAHVGGWLLTSLITSIGLRLGDMTIKVAVRQQLGANRRIPVTHTPASVARILAQADFMAWLVARAPATSTDMGSSTSLFWEQYEELVYRKSRSQLDYCMRTERGPMVRLSSCGPKENGWYVM